MTSIRRRFRVSLRALLVLLTLATLWLGKISMDARRQQDAVNWIIKHGGMVVYDWQDRDPRHQRPPRPRWLPQWVGDDYLFSVTMASINEPQDLSRLRYLPDLVSLSIADGDLADFDMSLLPGFADLEYLSLARCGVTDADLETIARCRELKSLNLSCNRLRDISELGRLGRLYAADLSRNMISDSSVLCGMQNLIQLDIKENPLSQHEISRLMKCLPQTSLTWSSPR